MWPIRVGSPPIITRVQSIQFFCFDTRQFRCHADVELPAWGSAEDVLHSLSEKVEPYRGMTRERLGLLGVAGKAMA